MVRTSTMTAVHAYAIITVRNCKSYDKSAYMMIIVLHDSTVMYYDDSIYMLVDCVHAWSSESVFLFPDASTLSEKLSDGLGYFQMVLDNSSSFLRLSNAFTYL